MFITISYQLPLPAIKKATSIWIIVISSFVFPFSSLRSFDVLISFFCLNRSQSKCSSHYSKNHWDHFAYLCFLDNEMISFYHSVAQFDNKLRTYAIPVSWFESQFDIGWFDWIYSQSAEEFLIMCYIVHMIAILFFLTYY